MQYTMPTFASDLKFRSIMLTPERAEQLLANNHPNNRSMKRGKILQMIGDIHAGNWQLTPEPIVVSDQGRLLDGQNRCSAVSGAGIAVPVFFCAGVPESVVVAMDASARFLDPRGAALNPGCDGAWTPRFSRLGLATAF